MDKRTKGLVVVGVLVIIAMIAVIIGIVGRKGYQHSRRWKWRIIKIGYDS